MRKREQEVKIELGEQEFYALSGGREGFFLERTFGYFREDLSNIAEGVFPRIKYSEAKRGGEGKSEENKEQGKKTILLSVKVKTRENDMFFDREEVDVVVKEGEPLERVRALVRSLGFPKEIIFEKLRKNIVQEGLVLSFDILPFGFFLEVEGSPDKIEAYIRAHDLSERSRITKAYLGLWEDYKREHNIYEEHCVFSPVRF